MKKSSCSILVLNFLLLFVSAKAQAAPEIKISCGPAEKVLTKAWASGIKDAKVNVDSKNSADAVNQFLDRGSDLLLVETAFRDSQSKKQGKRSLYFLPVALSAQVVVYNLPGVRGGELKLNPSVLSNIFLGVIKNWNDPAIQKMNPGLLLPDLDILVVHLSNENSLNDPFAAFLVQENPKWTLKREKDKNLHWPVGQNVGDDKKAFQKIRQWAGSIGVVDFIFAEQTHLAMARVQNASGSYIVPSVSSIEAAVPNVKEVSFEKPLTLIKNRKKQGYPLTNIIWAVADQNYGIVYHQVQKGPVLAKFLKFILSEEGQKQAADLLGLALPTSWIDAALTKTNIIQY